MNRDVEETLGLGPEEEDTVLVDRVKLGSILGMEVPPITFDSEASFQRLLRALDKRHYRRARRRRLIVCSIGLAIAIMGAILMARLLAP